MNSSFPTCAKAVYKHRYAISLSLEFLDISSFPQLLRCKADMVASYRAVPYLQWYYAWVVTSSAVDNYWKCYINVVTRTCSGFYWYIHTLPRALHALGSRAYISVKPLAAILQYINVTYTKTRTWLLVIGTMPKVRLKGIDQSLSCFWQLWVHCTVQTRVQEINTQTTHDSMVNQCFLLREQITHNYISHGPILRKGLPKILNISSLFCCYATC